MYYRGGIVTDAEDAVGASLILAELSSRGAGPYDNRQLSDAFDALGVRYAQGAGAETISLSGALLAEKLPEALSLVALIVQDAHLPDEELPGLQDLLLQDLDALKDNPAKLVMTELGKRYYPAPYDRSQMGSEAGIKAATIGALRDQYRKQFSPHGAILSIAGNVEPAEVVKHVEKIFGKWQGKAFELPVRGQMPSLGAHHIPYESNQLQIALAYPSTMFGDPLYYVARVTNGILSGGMFGRLFVEVREKRGLCYSVHSSVSSTRLFGTTLLYAGTTTERAQETLDVAVGEVRRLRGTVKPEELQRAKIDIKSGVIMSDESPGARSATNAADYRHLGRVRSLDEIQAGIEKVNIGDIDRYLEAFPPHQMMMVTLGQKELRFPVVEK